MSLLLLFNPALNPAAQPIKEVATTSVLAGVVKVATFPLLLGNIVFAPVAPIQAEQQSAGVITEAAAPTLDDDDGAPALFALAPSVAFLATFAQGVDEDGVVQALDDDDLTPPPFVLWLAPQLPALSSDEDFQAAFVEDDLTPIVQPQVQPIAAPQAFSDDEGDGTRALVEDDLTPIVQPQVQPIAAPQAFSDDEGDGTRALAEDDLTSIVQPQVQPIAPQAFSDDEGDGTRALVEDDLTPIVAAAVSSRAFVPVVPVDEEVAVPVTKDDEGMFAPPLPPRYVLISVPSIDEETTAAGIVEDAYYASYSVSYAPPLLPPVVADDDLFVSPPIPPIPPPPLTGGGAGGGAGGVWLPFDKDIYIDADGEEDLTVYSYIDADGEEVLTRDYTKAERGTAAHQVRRAGGVLLTAPAVTAVVSVPGVRVEISVPHTKVHVWGTIEGDLDDV